MIVDTYESDNRMGGGAQSILCYKPFNYQRWFLADMCETESYYHATNEGGYISGCDVYNQYGLTIKKLQ